MTKEQSDAFWLAGCFIMQAILLAETEEHWILIRDGSWSERDARINARKSANGGVK